MGGVTSKTFKDMLEEDEDFAAVGTPVVSKRVLDLQDDPRSPTHEVARTPIQVERTPDMVLDPRSPTCGISRTPIYYGRTQSKESESTATPVSHGATSITDSSLGEDLNLESGLEDSPFSGLEGIEMINRSISEPDITSIKDDLTELLPEPENKEPAGVSLKEASPPKKPSKELFKGHTNTVVTPNVNEKGKDRGPRSPLKVIGESQAQRSPLGMRNAHVDSPRAIVQRKQVNKLGMLRSQVGTSQPKGFPRSPVKYKLFSDDKENLES